MAADPVSLTVIILTLDEQDNLPKALLSIQGLAAKVFVLDSGSTDDTVSVALAGGATVLQRRFRHYGDQWRWALKNLPIETDWVMKLDADERVSPQLADELRALGATTPQRGFIVPIRLWFMGRPLHAKIDFLTRVWRNGAASMTDVLVNEHLEVDGPVGHLNGVLEHHDSPTLERWYAKQNRYTTLEAIARHSETWAAEPSLFGSQLERRMFLKKHFFNVPFRYAMLTAYNLVAGGAWRDGRVGFTWARLRADVMRMVELKLREIERTGHVPAVPQAPTGPFDPRVLATSLQQTLVGDDLDEPSASTSRDLP
ncbi:MAG: glycosyltransferase family 2 protein [Nannocystaceae bacterium]